MVKKTVDIGSAEVDGGSIDSPANALPAGHSYKGKGLECLFNEKSMQAAVVENGQTLVAARTLEKNNKINEFIDNSMGIHGVLHNPEGTLSVRPEASSCIADGLNNGREIPMNRLNFQFGSP